MSAAQFRLILGTEVYTDRNERSFRCEECPAAFNRRDLLLRHQATHAKNAKDGLIGPNRIAERATKACNSCVVSKVKCDNGRPCKRCHKKGLACLTRSADSSPIPQAKTAQEQLSRVFTHPTEQQVDSSQFDVDMGVDNVYLAEPNSDAQALLDLYNTTGYNQHAIPAFFEQIMVPAPDFMGADYLQSPPDLMAWMPEADWLGQVDIFGTDFTPAVDQMLESHVSQPFPAQSSENTDHSHEKIDINSAKRRHAVFKQSAWYCALTMMLTRANSAQVLDARAQSERFQ